MVQLSFGGRRIQVSATSSSFEVGRGGVAMPTTSRAFGPKKTRSAGASAERAILVGVRDLRKLRIVRLDKPSDEVPEVSWHEQECHPENHLVSQTTKKLEEYAHLGAQ